MSFLKRKTGRQRLFFGALSFAAIAILGIFAYINRNNGANALAEVSSDVWSIDLGFFDTKTDGGNTKLNNLDWYLAEGEYDRDGRTITFQINYSAQNVDKEYKPGDLQIRLDVPMPIKVSGTGYKKLTILNDLGLEWTDNAFLISNGSSVAAKPKNSTSTSDYDWEYECPEDQEYCVFTNLKTIEKNDSLQGSIQVALQMRLNGGSNGAPFFREINQERYNFEGKATLNNTIETDPVTINFGTDTRADWKKRYYTINNVPTKLDSFDGFSATQTQDYTWVHYYYFGAAVYNEYQVSGQKYEDPYTPDVDPENYRFAQTAKHIPIKDWHWEDNFPDDVVVLNNNKQVMSKVDGKYIISDSPANSDQNCRLPVGSSYYLFETCFEVYAGYPKDKYNEELGTNRVTNTARSRGTYFLEDEEVTLDEETAQVNLADFSLEYHGNDVGLTKTDITSEAINYQALKTNTGANLTYTFNAQSMNLENSTYDLVIGDDLIYYQDLSNGEFTKLDDDQYYFTKITAPRSLLTANGDSFNCSDYTIRLEWRTKGSTRWGYTQYAPNYNKPCGTIPSTTYDRTMEWTLPTNTVAWRLKINNLDKPIYSYQIQVTTNVHNVNIPENGKLYNFGFINVENNGTILNNVDIDSYSSELTRELIASHDLQTYGHYQQRAMAETSFVTRTPSPSITTVSSGLYVPNTNPINYNPSTDSFEGSFYEVLLPEQHTTDKERNPEILQQDLSPEDYITGLTGYSLLPYGMNITSTEEQLANSVWDITRPEAFYDQNAERVFASWSEAINYMRSHSTVNIIKNWRGSGQTLARFHIDFSERPVSIHSGSSNQIYFRGNFNIPYDIYAENEANDPGHVYTIRSSAANNLSYLNDPNCNLYRSSYTDDGEFLGGDIFADFDDDGDTTEKIHTYTHNFSILNAVSAEQSIKTTVSTDQTNVFSTDDSYVSIGRQYQYRLTVRTGGNNKATNVVLYDNLEMGYESNPYWQGKFLGIDTSFAEAQNDDYGNPIRIKAYYSTNAAAGSLAEDNSWQEYVEGTTDPTAVKSLAFQYLDQNGNPAIIPSNSFTFITVKMKAPSDNPSTDYAYNGFRSEWNAINQGGDAPIAEIEGISSNTTRVQLDHLFDIHVVKEWEDYNNKYNLRPSTVTPTLNRSTEDVDNSSSINIANGDSTLDYTDLHEYYKDEYDVTLAPITHYTTTRSYDADTLTYTFKSTLNTTKITVKKVWVDENDKYGLRPDDVDFTLKYDGAEINSNTLTITGNEDQFDFEDIPTLLAADHTVEIENIPNYTTRLEKSDDGLTYTFISTLNTEPITVTHTWNNDSDVTEARPSSINFKLNRENTTEQSKEQGTSDTTVSFQFENLPSTFIDDYSVSLDPSIENYTTTSTYDADTHTYNFVSTPNRFDINVVHIWDDRNNAYGFRPTNVDYTLTKSGATDQTESSSSSWTAEFSDLPVYYESTYDVNDVTVDHYTTTKAYDADTRTYTFTSTLSDEFNINIVHVWEDDNNSHNLRPTSVDYTLTKSGATDQTTTSSNDWTAGFEDLPLLEEPAYAVADVTVDHYTTTKTYDADTHTYTFTSRLSDEFDINIVHIWEDDNDVHGLRPSSVNYTLTKNGTAEQTTTSASDWTAGFEDLPLIDEPKYAVNDVTVDHYTTTKTYDADTRTYTFTSTLSDEFNINIVHIWNDRDNTYGFRPNSVEYTLTKNSAANQTTNSNSDWTAGFENLPLIDESKYAVNDVTVNHYTTTKTYDADTRTYTFTSTLSDEFDIEIIHIWEDLDDEFGLRPDSVNYKLTKDGATDQTTTSGSDWTAGFENLPLLDKELYGISMPVVPDDYTTTVEITNDGKTYTFTSKLNVFNFNVVNIWEDDNNSGNTRPDSLSFNLEYNEQSEDSRDIETGNNEERFSFENLLMSKQGDYTVTLAETPEGYTTEISFDEETMTITFIHKLIPKEENTGSTPLTLDRILIFAGIFAVSIIGAIISIVAIKKAKKEA